MTKSEVVESFGFPEGTVSTILMNKCSVVCCMKVQNLCLKEETLCYSALRGLEDALKRFYY